MKAPIIKNHKEYLEAKKNIKNFEPWLKKVLKKFEGTGEHPIFIELQENISRRQHAESIEAVKRYELIKSKQVVPRLFNFNNYGIFLIEARIYRGFTQHQLAKKLEIREDNIVAYENREYEYVPDGFIIEVLKALNLTILFAQ